MFDGCWTHPQVHLEALQEKINTYVRFIESGEMVDTYPKAMGRQPVIKVVGAHPLSADGITLFEKALSVLAEVGIDLRFAMLPEPSMRRRSWTGGTRSALELRPKSTTMVER